MQDEVKRLRNRMANAKTNMQAADTKIDQEFYHGMGLGYEHALTEVQALAKQADGMEETLKYITIQRDAMRETLKKLDAANYDRVTDVPNIVLLTCALNAYATTSCNGHTKREMNEARYERYTEELKRRGIELTFTPTELFKIGEYNGMGAF